VSATPKQIFDDWNCVWFTPAPPGLIASLRVACGLIALVHFVGLGLVGSTWVGEKGWLNSDAGLYLIGHEVEGTGSSYRWSVLFSRPQLTTLVSMVGIAGSAATVAGLGARLSPLIVWLCLGMFHHRAPLLALVYEPLLTALFAYLVIDPGRTTWTWRPGFCSGDARISVNLAAQLARCHFWIWIAFSLASMLAYPIWWDGEAGWLLLQRGPEWLRLGDGWQFVGQCLTHLVIASQAAILLFMTNPIWNGLGRWALGVFILCMLLLLGDWMYAAVLAAASLSAWPISFPFRFRSNNDVRDQ